MTLNGKVAHNLDAEAFAAQHLASHPQARVKYAETRRLNTIAAIDGIVSNSETKNPKHGLVELLEGRKKLAKIYAEDGARNTEHVIRTVDIPLIEQAIIDNATWTELEGPFARS